MTPLPVLRRIRGTYVYTFWCPGCHRSHFFRVLATLRSHQEWTWNGSLFFPTVSPSILYEPDPGRRCRLRIQEGQLVFLPDCWHDLAKRTVDMIPYEDV